MTIDGAPSAPIQGEIAMHLPKALCIGVLSGAAAISPSVAHAENAIGRYEMVTLPTKPGSFDSRVMILDTADGHLWQWWETPAVGNATPNSGITYLGKVAPGSTTTETTPLHRSSAPELFPPRH
jgi:hypothetical protein